MFNLDIKQKRDNSLFYKSDVTNPKKLKITLDKIFKNNKVIDAVINCAYQEIELEQTLKK